MPNAARHQLHGQAIEGACRASNGDARLTFWRCVHAFQSVNVLLEQESLPAGSAGCSVDRCAGVGNGTGR